MLDVSDELYARPPKLKIFVSSQMAGFVLDAERQAAVKAIESTGFAAPWSWEHDAHAGPYSAEGVCLGHARTSDGLVLIIATDLTPMTRREYQEAYRAGAPCYIFLKEGTIRSPGAAQFVEDERTRAVTTNFGNDSELRTLITRALWGFSNRAVREKILRSRADVPPHKSLDRLKSALLDRLGKAGR